MATYIMLLLFFMGMTCLEAAALGSLLQELRRVRAENQKLRNANQSLPVYMSVKG